MKNLQNDPKFQTFENGLKYRIQKGKKKYFCLCKKCQIRKNVKQEIVQENVKNVKMARIVKTVQTAQTI